MYLLRPLLLLLAAASWTATVHGQDKPEGGDKQAGVDKIQALQNRQALEKGDGADGDAANAELAAKGAPIDPVRHNTAGFCRFDAAVVPKRLLPGQTGTCLVTMILEGDSVLPSPAPLSIKTFGNGGLQAGQWSIRPAQNAKVAKAFVGQPAYDNWAVIEMPVTMAQNAPLGTRQSLTIEFAFDLVGGTNGVNLGKFDNRLSVTCEVGASISPAVQAAAANAAANAATHEAAVPANGGSAPAAGATATPGERPLAGDGPAARPEVIEPSIAPSQPQPTEHAVDAPAPKDGSSGLVLREGGSQTWLVVGGAGLLVAVGLLALVRRR